MRNEGLEILALRGYTEVNKNRRKQYKSFLTRFCKWLAEHILEEIAKKKKRRKIVERHVRSHPKWIRYIKMFDASRVIYLYLYKIDFPFAGTTRNRRCVLYLYLN